MKNQCYFKHESDPDELFTCFDGNKVCIKCCTQNCPIETQDLFSDCSKAGHPTWPIFEKNILIPSKLVCLETYWSDQLFNPLSVKRFLEALSPLLRYSLQFAHRFVETTRGLDHYTKYPNGLLWQDPISWDAPIFYLAMHGEPGSVVSVLDVIGPNELCSAFEGYGGYPNLIYFGACSVFKGSKGKRFANDFLKSSGSMAIVGYSEDINWMTSLITDLLFLHKFYNDPTPWKNLDKIFNAVIEEFKPAASLGFTMFRNKVVN